MTTVRDYPDIPARVLGEARPEAAEAVWNAVADWVIGNQVSGISVEKKEEAACVPSPV